MKFCKNIIISLVILFSGCSSTHKNPLSPSDSDKTSYFYINSLNIDKAEKADSLTYFYTDSEPSIKLIRYFQEFSKYIGDKNGAVIISPNTGVERAYTLVNEISNCNKVEPTLWPVIVFEDRTKQGTCYPLYIQDVNYGSLIAVLDIIQQMIDSPNNRNKLQATHNTKDRISIFIKEHPSLKVIEGVLYKLVDLLGEKLA